MKRSLKALAVVFSLILPFLASCRTSSPASEVGVSDLTIGYAALRISLPVFVAQEKGIFAKHGLNVRLQKYDTAQPMMDALVSGTINVGGYCALPITFSAIARSKVDLLFITALMEDQSHPVSMLIVREDGGISTVSELAHKRIGILPTRAYEVWLRAILAKNNVDPNDVIIQQIPPALEPQALMSGSVQALFTNDPGATNTLAHPGAKLLVKGAIVPQYTYEPFYFGSFNIRKDWAVKNPDTVVKISQSLDEAIDLINSDQGYAKRLMAKYVDSKLEPISNQYPDSLYWKSDKISSADLKKIYDYDRSANIISTPLTLEGAQYRWRP